MNQHGSGPLLGRRDLIVRASGVAVGAFVGIGLAGCGGTPTAARPTVLLERHGAKGDGRTDDTAAIQSAIDAAPGGYTVLGKQGSVYLLNGQVSFPRDDITLDLAGATLQTGPKGTGGAAPSDTIFTVMGRRRIRITNGRIAASLSSYSGSLGGAKILLGQSARCAVSRLDADCRGSALVNIVAGGRHLIERNHVVGGNIGGVSCSQVLVRGNVLEASPYDAIGFAGYRGGPANGNQYIENVIRRCGRIGIEDHSPDGPTYNSDTVIRGNLIEAPAHDTTSGTAISAIGNAAVIEQNEIRDAKGYAIETTGLGTRVLQNRIGWQSTPNPFTGSPAIVINSSMRGAPRAIVSGNHIVNALVGISVFANPYLEPIIVERNVIENPASIGIALAAPSGTFSGPTCSDNVLSFSVPGAEGLRARIGIQTTTGTKLLHNRILFGPHTYSRNTVDIPIEFEGDDVIARDNVVVSQRGANGHLVSASRGGSWSGWTLTDNQFLDGAAANLSNLIHPVLSGNVGQLTP